MSDPSRSRAPWWAAPDPAGWRVILPAAVVLIVNLGSLLGGLPRDGFRRLLRGDIPGPEGEFVVALLFAVGSAAVLLAARAAPGPVVAGITLLSTLDIAVSDDDVRLPALAVAVAVVSAVVRDARAWALVSVVAALLAVVLLSPVIDDPPTVGQIAWTVVLLAAAFGAGELLRTARERRTRDAEAEERRQGTAMRTERERLARELHDVLAHSLSQISVQAGVGLHLSDPDKPEALARAREALANVREVSGAALADVRGVIGALRAPGDAPLTPDNDLSRIPDLLRVVRDAGIQPTLDLDATDDVPRSVQAAAYRIVQEALTNVARHARARSVAVRISAVARVLTIDVVDDGVGAGATPRTGGLGLAGMSERAQLAGGSLSAGPRAGGGWAVRAVLPFERPGSA